MSRNWSCRIQRDQVISVVGPQDVLDEIKTNPEKSGKWIRHLKLFKMQEITASFFKTQS